jgi:hypothetical protein
MKSPEEVETLEVAKHDGRGRRLAAAGERKKLLAAYQASGLTQARFAEREGINRFTFATWLRNDRVAAARPAAPAAPRFLEVRVPPVAGFSLGGGDGGRSGAPGPRWPAAGGAGKGAAVMFGFPGTWKIYLAGQRRSVSDWAGFRLSFHRRRSRQMCDPPHDQRRLGPPHLL